MSDEEGLDDMMTLDQYQEEVRRKTLIRKVHTILLFSWRREDLSSGTPIPMFAFFLFNFRLLSFSFREFFHSFLSYLLLVLWILRKFSIGIVKGSLWEILFLTFFPLIWTHKPIVVLLKLEWTGSEWIVSTTKSPKLGLGHNYGKWLFWRHPHGLE